ncbi:recombinase family protein [Leisingera sp. M527]|uniref:recombinase family protein n=1 Tax=Leisingera sp. M527 TaxID=2867014 RepID=UPI0021A93A06|nr:recombinase family protein [Leisingera sp. M527]UWQ35020.1 recombinase family protein [Leisingera sp. M527]
MKEPIQKPASATHAVIYCRVSSTKQKIEGRGLESQEHRCRKYAVDRGYEVEAVFPDDITGGVDFMKRPGMVALLSYLEAQPAKSYVVIFDDLKRFARKTAFHLKLREELARRGARVECLNFKFEDTPEGQFIETVMAAQGELEREQNARQTRQKMQARLEKGYSVFAAPIGYVYGKDKLHGKILTRDEPIASIVQEALEGFAMGRFQSQAEVKRFLESQPAFPKDLSGGLIRQWKVSKMLRRVTYAGYIEAPDWGVSLRKGHHEPLISFETYTRIQERLNGSTRAPARKDLNEDFPMRGFVLCNDCGEPLTACWSKGKTKRYPYYLCDTRGCESYRKSVRRADIDEGFEAFLQALQPTKQLFGLVRDMFIAAWDMRLAQAKKQKSELEKQLRDTSKQVDAFLDRIVNADNPALIEAYEQRLDKLGRERILLEEKAGKIIPPKGRLEEFIELSLEFLSNPWDIYKNGSLAIKKTVQRLAFEEPVRYCRKQGYRTPKITLPFKVLDDLNHQKCDMVPPHGLEPRTY